MGRFRAVADATGYAIPAPGSRRDEGEVQALLALCDSDDARTRQVAIKNLCTFHVQTDDARVWARLAQLIDDTNVRVRRDALHALTDSTPAARVASVVDVLETRYDEPDASLRRRIRKTLAHYRKTGKLTDAPR